MPLIKRSKPSAEDQPSAAPPSLGDADPARRRAAARAMATDAAALPALAEALAREPDANVREAILSSLIAIGGPAAVAAMVPELRSDDSTRRMPAVEALQALPGPAADSLPGLLDDADPDVRVMAAEVARGLPIDTATTILVARLEREAHPNVAGAIVDVLAEIGTPAALPALAAAARRFAGEPFLPYALQAAMARIGR